MPDFNHPPLLVMGNMVVVMLTAKFTGTVITFTNIDCKSDDSARKLHSHVCTCVTYKVMALPVNFDQFLQLTFTEIKLTITRGGILGEGDCKRYTGSNR